MTDLNLTIRRELLAAVAFPQSRLCGAIAGRRASRGTKVGGSDQEDWVLADERGRQLRQPYFLRQCRELP